MEDVIEIGDSEDGSDDDDVQILSPEAYYASSKGGGDPKKEEEDDDVVFLGTKDPPKPKKKPATKKKKQGVELMSIGPKTAQIKTVEIRKFDSKPKRPKMQSRCNCEACEGIEKWWNAGAKGQHKIPLLTWRTRAHVFDGLDATSRPLSYRTETTDDAVTIVVKAVKPKPKPKPPTVPPLSIGDSTGRSQPPPRKRPRLQYTNVSRHPRPPGGRKS